LDLIEKSSQDKKYNDSQNADIWFSALRGQAFLIAGKKEAALKALKYSEALLQPNEPPEVLQLIYANGYIYSNQEEKALGIVNKIRENPTSSLFLEATALWINICDLSFNELEKQLSHTEKNYSKIAEVLARKAQDEERYDSAEKYARISIEKSKEKHLQPCYQVLADILMGKRFGVYIQIGFIKKHIDKKDWTDFDEVVKCYILSLENIEQYASSRLKSIIIYNLFLTHFIVADYYNTEKYADKLSELGLIDAGILEALLSILLRMGKVDKVISICEKREAPLLKIPRLMYIVISQIIPL